MQCSPMTRFLTANRAGVQATGLERILEELKALKDVNAQTAESQKLNMERIKQKRDQKKKLEEELDKLVSLDHHDSEIALLAAKQYWCEVELQEGLVRKCETARKEAERKLDKAHRKLDELNRQLSDLGNIDDIARETASIQDELDRATGEIEECQRRVALAAREVGARENSIRIINSNKIELEARVKSCSGQVNWA